MMRKLPSTLALTAYGGAPPCHVSTDSMHVVYGGTADRKVTGSAMATDSRARVVHSIVSVVKISQLLSALLSDCGYASQTCFKIRGLASQIASDFKPCIPLQRTGYHSQMTAVK